LKKPSQPTFRQIFVKMFDFEENAFKTFSTATFCETLHKDVLCKFTK